MPTDSTSKTFGKEVTWERRQSGEAQLPPRSESTGTASYEESAVRSSLQFLLCTCVCSDRLCACLREILEASELRPRAVEVLGRDEVNPARLAARAKASDPDLIFLLLPAERSAETVSMFQALRASFGVCPLIAVTEGMDGRQIYSLLQLGASDFLTVPLRSTEVVPRVRRLLDQTLREDALV